MIYYSFVFCYFLYIVFCDVTFLYLICSIVLRARIKDDDDDDIINDHTEHVTKHGMPL